VRRPSRNAVPKTTPLPSVHRGPVRARTQPIGAPEADWSFPAARVYGYPEGGTTAFFNTPIDTRMQSVRLLFGTLVLGMIVFAGGGAGCSMLANSDDGTDDAVERGVAEVDSLHAPTHIAASDTLALRLTGTVGPNGCHSFDGFDVERSGGQLTITPVVEHRTGQMCTQAIVPLDETYAAAPPFAAGTLTVVVPQPDRPDVTAAVEVTE